MGGKKKEVKEKPLEKMTSKELRGLAVDIPQIIGAHGMNKAELISEIKQARGIEETGGKKKSGTVRNIKKKIRELKAKRHHALEEKNEKMSAIYRKRISRLKKKTRRFA